MSREELWNNVDKNLQVIHGNLGICCQEYCDAATAIFNLEEAMEKLALLREQENND